MVKIHHFKKPMQYASAFTLVKKTNNRLLQIDVIEKMKKPSSGRKGDRFSGGRRTQKR